jgi:probable F420-dependent oxidoreductase
MQFGTALPMVQQMAGTPDWQIGDDPAPIVAVARKADALGYSWLPCSDHVVVPKRVVAVMGAPWYEPATTLSFLAGVTERVRLLSHVVILPYHNPLHVAKQYATLDRLSGGRVILGVGVGHLRPEFEALRAPYDERGAVTDEYIAIVKALWTQEEASFQGQRYEFSEVHLGPRPLQRPRPPIWVGGNSRRAARRAAELADGWVPFSVSLEDIRDRLRYIRRLPGYEERSAPLEVVVPANMEIAPRPIDGERAPFAGSREQVSEDIRGYQEAGVTGMTVAFRAHSLEEHMEKLEEFAREMLPAFS